MRRACVIKAAGQWPAASAVDRVLLDSGDRQRRRIVLTCEGGTRFLLELARPAMLRDGDGLVLDDGSIVRVAGRPEHLVEIAAHTGTELVRLAWHLGNRHTDVQIAGDRLRIRRDHVLENMVAGLGATVKEIEAPFDPEDGAAHDDRHVAGNHDHG